MKTIASLMLAISLSLPLASAGAEDGVTNTLDGLTVVLHTTLDPSLRFMRPGIVLNFGIPPLTAAPEFAGGFGNAHLKAEGEFAAATQSKERDNIRWHSVADIALVMNNG